MDKGILKNLYLSTTLTPHTTLENAFVNHHHPSSTLQNIAEPYIYMLHRWAISKYFTHFLLLEAFLFM